MCSRNFQGCSKPNKERPGKNPAKQGGWTKRSQGVPSNLSVSEILNLIDDRLLSLLLTGS